MPNPDLTRRQFLASGGGAAVALAGCKKEAQAAADVDPKSIDMKYRILGRTKLKVSEIGFGGFPVENPAVLDHAIDIGINYVDTAPDYRSGRSETVIGKVMKRRRKEVVLATKWHPGPTTKRKVMLDSLNESLRRLRTDHVDIVMIHSVKDINRIKNPELFEAFRIAKDQGKVSFLGLSSHSPTLMEVMNEAIRCGEFDMMLAKYNFLDYPKQPDLLARANAAGMGIVAMKTLGGAKHADLAPFRGKERPFERAALKWVLSNKHVTNLIISIDSLNQVRNYGAASGRKLAWRDEDLLHRYAQLVGREVCRGCEECHGACPSDVPVADVLRYSMYHDHYGQQTEARRLYGLLPAATAAACLDCPAPCETDCFHGLPVRTQMLGAHMALG
jgi:predicted aldo/keto reductase-like oxidoreductase